MLHIRGTCTIGEDGVKTVEVELFSPISTVFELRSEEPSGHGGRGRAPPAMTYVAAGLGFCFMTQIGRYADIVDRDLDAYRIVQETHFSVGARERGEAPGRADPVETAVFLDADGSESSARDIVEMSEQTCFLHALCRTELDAPTVEITTQ
ncbi:OsmC family protein [Halobellus ordinarius]|uniref:OsmC family protein n=1 Tax=Halobellus ordinarius TaxID=3075120 RepID=UPI00288007BF|nr:OsmC family protein [Halobellus sp. ZY16]